jgi:Nucleotidyl transferase AbiEii toxin, Type IV TA system
MNPIFAAALEVQAFCRARGWRFCFIGGVAVQRWGEPRLTQDVDLTLLTGFGTEQTFVDALLERFAARRADAREFALRHRVLLVQSQAEIPIDISLGAIPFEERATGRATDFRIAPDVSLLTCSAEDLIVFKVFAGRERDWLDVEGIAIRQAGRLEEDLIRTELGPLLELKGDTVSFERLRRTLETARA